MAKASSKLTPARKTAPKKSPRKRTKKKTMIGRLKDAALSTEMLSAGLAAAGTAVASSPKARRAIYEAGVDATDEAGKAASRAMNSTSRFAALIGKAVAEAVERALTGDWLAEENEQKSQRKKSAQRVKKRKTGERKSPRKAN